VLLEISSFDAPYRFFGLHIRLLLNKMIIKHFNLNLLEVYILCLLSISPHITGVLSTGKYWFHKHIKSGINILGIRFLFLRFSLVFQKPACFHMDFETP